MVFKARRSTSKLGPKPSITENKNPIFEPDFPLDFGQVFSGLSVYVTVEAPSAQKPPTLVMDGKFGLTMAIFTVLRGKDGAR